MTARVKVVISGFLILLIVPLFAILLNWSWQPQILNHYAYTIYLFTHTAGIPWAFLTTIILFLLFCVTLGRRSLKSYFLLGVIIFLALFLGQVIKSVVKEYLQESRPFVLWIEKQYHIPPQEFYALPRPERAELVVQTLRHENTIPNWLIEHWQVENGYSLPSGHILFAATWAFLALLFIRRSRYFPLVIALVAWAIIIEVSRLMLGMHHPWDEIGSVVVSLILSLISYVFARKWHIVE